MVQTQASLQQAFNRAADFQRKGDVAQAEQLYRKILARRPRHAGSNCNLGVILKNQGKYEEAKKCYDIAIAAKPDYVAAYTNKATVFSAQYEYGEAEKILRNAIDICGEQGKILAQLGWCLREQGKLDDARHYMSKALETDPNNGQWYNDLGSIHFLNHRNEEAEACFRKAIQINSNSPDAISNLAVILNHKGKGDEAAALYRRAFEHNKTNTSTIYNMVIRGKYKDVTHPDIAHIHNLLKTQHYRPDEELLLHFALGHAYSGCKDHENSIYHYNIANKMKRDLISFNVEDILSFVKRSKQFFTADFFEKCTVHGSDSDTPIFIVGMPRSGTTLTEQIISAHPLVHGAGELVGLEAETSKYCKTTQNVKRAFPTILNGLGRKDLRAIVAQYEKLLYDEAPENTPYITDKMPLNAMYLGLIWLLYPNARVIHCKRHPLDICMSNYCHMFTSANSFTYNMKELAQYYTAYEDIMNYWKDVCPLPILDVQYEDVVADIDGQSRKIIDFLGLEWDDACAQPHKNARTVRTASVTQVREKVYSSSKERWRPYERHIGDLIDILGTEIR